MRVSNNGVLAMAKTQEAYPIKVSAKKAEQVLDIFQAWRDGMYVLTYAKVSGSTVTLRFEKQLS